MLTKKDVADTLGLSCVEKYFLAWLSKYFDITQLYGCSFVGLTQVFDDFARGATYENYCYLPRLQDTAEEYAIVTHEYKAFTAADAMAYLRKMPDIKLCLMRVNSTFFTDYKRAAWRKDHYVCVNSDLEWINEYPLSAGGFDPRSFTRVFDGAICTYQLNQIKVDMPDCVTRRWAVQKFSQECVPSSLSRLESAIGVLRVTRKRLEKYYASNVKVQSLLSEENTLLDKMYFNIRLRRLKDNERVVKDYDDIISNIKELFRTENKITEELSK